MSKKIEQHGTLELSASDIEAVKPPQPSKAEQKPQHSSDDDDSSRDRDNVDDDPSLVRETSGRVSENSLPGRQTDGRLVIDDPFARTVIDERYEVLRCLGTGAMGSVFLVNHLRLGKLFALKMVNPELAGQEEFIARFQREADACSRLEHPNCINVTDFGQTSDGSLYLVMEYADGHLLSDLLEQGPLPLDEAFTYVRQILQGLKHAHGEGLIHRDIKMENIVICNKDGDDPLVKILDFGMARPELADKEGHRITRNGVVLGTPQYMAPEQIRDQNVDARSDLYAVGITLFRLLTAKIVFDSQNVMHIFAMKLKQPGPTLKEVTGKRFPDALESFIAKAIERDPEKRFASADEMLEALDTLSSSLLGITAARTSVFQKRSTARHDIGAFFSSLFTRIREQTIRWYTCREFGLPPSWKTRLIGLVTTRLGRILLMITLVAVLGAFLSISIGTNQPTKSEVAAQHSPETASKDVSEKVPDSKAPEPSAEPLPAAPQKADVEDTPPAAPSPAEPVKIEIAEAQPVASVTDDPVLIDAAVLIEKKRCRLAEKKILESNVSTSARATYLLGKINVCRGKRTEALELFEKAIELDERYRSDSGILEDVRKMLNLEKVRGAALTFLAEVMDKAALPTLIRLAGHHIVRDVRHRAQALVEQKGALSHVDMDVALELDLNQSKSCKEKREIVGKLGKLNTKRARQALIRARDSEVKEGFFRTRYRHACVRPLIISTLKKMRKEKSLVP